MATHSSILAWRIPWTEKPGGLQSTGSQRVRHDWGLHFTSLCWRSDSVYLPRLGHKSIFVWLGLLDCSFWGKLAALKVILLEKAMAPHSSTLAWKIPWAEKAGRLQSMGSRIVRHDWETSLSLFTFMHWRRKWQPIPVFLPGESQGRGSLVGGRLWGRTESDTTEAT